VGNGGEKNGDSPEGVSEPGLSKSKVENILGLKKKKKNQEKEGLKGKLRGKSLGNYVRRGWRLKRNGGNKRRWTAKKSSGREIGLGKQRGDRIRRKEGVH